jgi:hypothetical protein
MGHLSSENDVEPGAVVCLPEKGVKYGPVITLV